MNRRRQRVLRQERLEPRIALAADLEITNAFLVDRFNNPAPTPVEGEQVYVRAIYRTTDLSPTDTYFVTFEMDGVKVASQEISGVAGTDLPFFRFRTVGYSSPGTRQIRVVVDGENDIVEADETNNEFAFSYLPAKTDIPNKLVFPVGGIANDDWSIANYSDVDVRDDVRADYRGGPFQYEGHDALDVAVTNFNRMETGIPVLAAADGTVITAVDGNFDREIGPNDNQANYVSIDHGSGWIAHYFHLQRDTVAVEVGQQVVAGQTIGLIGSSGSSNDAHLHFSLRRNGSKVEPMFAPDDYFVDPVEYQGDQPPIVMESLISDRHPIEDHKEGPNDIRTFRSDGTQDTWFWTRVTDVNIGEVLDIEWYRPSGELDATYNWTPSGVVKFAALSWFRNTRSHVGTWTVVMKHNGTELTRESFDVVAAGGTPELDVRHGSTYIIDGRSTPIDFGQTGIGASSAEQTFTISNRGTAPLTVSNFVAPTGFTIVGTPPSSIAAGGSSELRLLMSHDVPGHQWGDVRFDSNDSDESQFNFGIEGMVTGATSPTAPQLTHATTALAIEGGFAIRSVFPALAINDTDNTDFVAGTLTAKIVSGREPTDRLVFDTFDSTNGITVEGSTVSVQNVPVGTIDANGSGEFLQVLFSSSTTLEQLEAVGRAISFWDQNVDSSSRRRIVELNVTDPDGQTSNTIRRAVFHNDDNSNQPPSIEPISNQTTNSGQQMGPLGLLVSDANDGNVLTITATSSNTALLGDNAVSASFFAGQWRLTATPNVGQFGATTITVSVADPSGVTVTESFQLVVKPAAARPVITTTAADDTNLDAIAVQVDFGTAVSGFSVNDLDLVNASASGFETTDNQVFRFDVLPSTDALVSVAIASGAASDSFGTETLAADALTFTSDRTAPIATISSSVTSPSNTPDAISMTVDFGEMVLGFVMTDIVVTGGVASGFGTDDNQTFTFDVVPAGDGTVEVSIDDDVAMDVAGNLSQQDSLRVVIDQTPPTLASVVRHSPLTEQTTSTDVTFRLAFSEDVVGLDKDDLISVGNGVVNQVTSVDAQTYDVSIQVASGYLGQLGVDVIARASVADVAGNEIAIEQPPVDETYDIISDAPTLDFGDAPTIYGVTLADDGARHGVGPLRLGTTISAEADGVASANADSDDDDGVTVIADLVRVSGETSIASLMVSVTPGFLTVVHFLDAWFDWNGDGDFNDQGEQVAAGFDAISVNGILQINVPGDAVVGTVNARFRLSSQGGLTPNGAAADGEVEDYQFAIADGDQAFSSNVQIVNNVTVVQVTQSNVSVGGDAEDLFRVANSGNGSIQVTGDNGNDQITFSTFETLAGDLVIDGGLGRNEIIVSPSSLVFDATQGLILKNIQTIDLSAAQTNVISIDSDAVAQMSTGQTLGIIAEGDDEVVFRDASRWRMTQPTFANGVFSHVVTDADAGVSLQLSHPNAWRNMIQPSDVNNDGKVTASDALRIVNELKRREFSDSDTSQLNPVVVAQWQGIYFDQNGDERLTALDALRVVNELKQQASGEAESAVSSAILSTQSIDASISGLDVEPIFELVPAKQTADWMTPPIASQPTVDVGLDSADDLKVENVDELLAMKESFDELLTAKL